MSEEYRSDPGTIVPTLFVGLGGAGSRIVDRIGGRAAQLPNWESQLRPLTSFVSIDTNELDQHQLRNVPEGNRLHMAAFDKAKAIGRYRRSKDPLALQWLDPADQPRLGYTPGAGQTRVEARLGLFFHSPEIRQRLRELVLESLQPGITWRQSSPWKFNAYLFCSLAGGTGSGSFLSIAYLINDVLEEQNCQPRVIGNFLLSTLMLGKVGPELHPDIHANTYAALKELEHLTKLDYPSVSREGRTFDQFVYCRDESNPAVQIVHSRPFFLSFIFDRPSHLALPDAEAAIADAAFLQTFTPIIDNVVAGLDNYEKPLEKLSGSPGDLTNLGRHGYTKNFGAFGAAAMVLPGHELLDYVSTRFAAQAIRSQITFSVDPNNPADDRARALAKLAINYSDPKFLNMADDRRERAINQSFVASVQEMARQDATQDMLDGYWYRLVESIDEGEQTGVNDKGEPVHAESQSLLIERKLEEARRDLLDRVSIKERAFVFHREGVNQYIELVNRLLKDIRGARLIVDENVRGLEAAAAEGEVIGDLKLDPIAERYLVICLLERCERTLIPDAQQQLEKAKIRDVSNPKVRERVEREIFEALKAGAEKRGLFRGDQDFLAARDEAQVVVREIASAARAMFDAEIRLRQLRALLEFLQRRSRQYARLATRMDSLVQDLEREAERLRRGETALVPPLALRVEVFETLDEPRRRIWDRAYRALFIDDGRYISTFDRQLLASAITQELKPVVRADGTVAEKSIDQTVSDLERALRELGRECMRPTIFGQVGQPGLDLVRGLELEATLILESDKLPGQSVTEAEIDDYREKKFRALAQICGVLARVSAADTEVLDGAKTNHTRQLIVGVGEAGRAQASEKFVARLKDALSAGGRQIKVSTWHDPRLIIVHDVDLPIPLYYLDAVVGEIEDAYLHVAADKNRGHHLHTDFHWEESLPNLNPKRSEIAVGWALSMLADGLGTPVITHTPGQGISWQRSGQDKPVILGNSLATALYRLGEFHRLPNLQTQLEKDLRGAHEGVTPEDELARREELLRRIGKRLAEMELRQAEGRMTQEDVLDLPILRTLKIEMAKQTFPIEPK